MNNIGMLLPFIVLIGAMFLMTRSAKKKQAQAAEMRNQMQPGTGVRTIGGMYATVKEIQDETVLLEVAPGVHAVYAKNAIGAVLDDAEYNRTARTLADFRVQTIRADRALRRDPSYEPKFVNYPLTTRRIPVELSADEYAMLQRVKETGLGATDGEALRAAFFFWYQRNLRPSPLRGKVL